MLTITNLNLFLLTIYLLCMMMLASRRSSVTLTACGVVTMVCVPLLGGSSFTIFDYSSNVGNVFFAVVMFGLTLKQTVYGTKAARDAVEDILFVLTVIFGSIFLLQQAKVLSPLFETHVRIAAASFFSFMIVQSIFIRMLRRFVPDNTTPKILIITILIQALDSAVFFPLAFYGALPIATVFQFAVVGWLSKSTIALISTPFLIWDHANKKHIETQALKQLL